MGRAFLAFFSHLAVASRSATTPQRLERTGQLFNGHAFLFEDALYSGARQGAVKNL
jgi:hypothetical protein